MVKLIRYVRLLSYDNACKVIDFVNKKCEGGYAHITVGGVSMEVTPDHFKDVETYIKSLNVRYEIGAEAPHKVVAHIVSYLKSNDII